MRRAPVPAMTIPQPPPDDLPEQRDPSIEPPGGPTPGEDQPIDEPEIRLPGADEPPIELPRDEPEVSF
jgi:hypothetical protein